MPLCQLTCQARKKLRKRERKGKKKNRQHKIEDRKRERKPRKKIMKEKNLHVELRTPVQLRWRTFQTAESIASREFTLDFDD
jgi:hypothetical protein